MGPEVQTAGPGCSATRTPLDVVPPFWPRHSQQGLGEAGRLRSRQGKPGPGHGSASKQAQGVPQGPKKLCFCRSSMGRGSRGDTEIPSSKRAGETVQQSSWSLSEGTPSAGGHESSVVAASCPWVPSLGILGLTRPASSPPGGRPDPFCPRLQSGTTTACARGSPSGARCSGSSARRAPSCRAASSSWTPW